MTGATVVELPAFDVGEWIETDNLWVGETLPHGNMIEIEKNLNGASLYRYRHITKREKIQVGLDHS